MEPEQRATYLELLGRQYQESLARGDRAKAQELREDALSGLMLDVGVQARSPWGGLEGLTQRPVEEYPHLLEMLGDMGPEPWRSMAQALLAWPPLPAQPAGPHRGDRSSASRPNSKVVGRRHGATA